MILSKKALMKKFPQLERFKDQKWLEEEAIKSDCNYKEIPLKCSLLLISEMIDFCQQNRFNSNWEFQHSIQIRLKQIESLLKHFCEDSNMERTIKGKDI